MARPNLPRPEWPWLLRSGWRIYAALASLKLAVVLIALLAVVLGWATFVESRYGTPAVHFGIYGTWWFAALNLLLGLNVLCAALIRFPWKRHQTGFVVTHAGILVLLVGTLLSRLGGIDAQLPVFEGESEHWAFQDSQHFDLAIYPLKPAKAAADNSADKATHDSAEESAEAGLPTPERVLGVPFVSGPFNWQDYATLGPFPWRLAHRDRGVLLEQDGIRLEVLDYLNNSNYLRAKPIKLRVKAGEADWQEIELAVRPMDDMQSAHGSMGVGSRQKLAGGERIVFWTADSLAATEAFRQSAPQGALGTNGLLVLWAYGNRYEFPVDTLMAKKRMPIGETGMELELYRLDEQFLATVLLIHVPGEPPQRMVLFADMPEFNKQDPEHGIYGSYWVDLAKMPKPESLGAEAQAMRDAAGQPRIDLVEGTDGKLYQRTWKSPTCGPVTELPQDEARIAIPSSEQTLQVTVADFNPSNKPGKQVIPAPTSKRSNRQQTRQARVRLTVDGQSEEFWLEGMAETPDQVPQADQRRVVVGKGRRVAVSLPRDQIDVGFRIYLHEFQRKLDPGTSQASWYASLIDQLDRDDPGKRLQEKVLITLNEPVNFTDPASGRSYRVYQESFFGPLKPGDPTFDRIAGGRSQRNELFLSWLTFNYDPGRGLKYLGSLLIVAGIGIMFYMRAYFFRRRDGSPEGGL